MKLLLPLKARESIKDVLTTAGFLISGFWEFKKTSKALTLLVPILKLLICTNRHRKPISHTSAFLASAF